MSIALTILGISLLIVLHELGHFLVARAAGMRVIRFSIGFGPKLWERQWGETRFRLAAVLLGGYVQIHGMGPSDPSQPPDDDRSYKRRPLWQRMAVIFAGPAANWLVTALLIAGLAFSVGYEQLDEGTTTVGQVVAGAPADLAGVLPGDRLVAVAGQAVHDWRSLVAAIQAHPEEEITVDLERDGVRLAVPIRPRRAADGGYGQIGVGPATVTVRAGLGGSVIHGLVGAWELSAGQAVLLWDWVTGQRAGRLAGLPEIVKTVADQADHGLEYLVDAMAKLSVMLFLLNLLPIPALDGSRLLFLAVEAVRRRPLDERLEATIHGIGFLLLLALILFVSVRWFFV